MSPTMGVQWVSNLIFHQRVLEKPYEQRQGFKKGNQEKARQNR